MTVFAVCMFGREELAAYARRDDAERYLAGRPWRRENGTLELTIIPLDIPARICVVCEQQAITAPELDFCRHCHYTGRAQAHIRARQIERFTKAFPDASYVGPEWIGAGFCFAIRFDADDPHVVLSNSEGNLPEGDEGEAVPNGGWGYVGLHLTGNGPEAVLHFDPSVAADYRRGLTDGQAIELITTRVSS